jgi:hypothetical protein
MRIKRRLSAALFVLVTQACMAQSSTPDVIASSGGYQSNASGSLSWTLGEPIIEPGSSSNNYLTQGFEQPSGIVISSVDNTTKPSITVTAYPNPSSSLVYVNSTTATSMLAEVYDLAGQMVYKKTVSGDDNGLNLGNLANGMYLLKVFTAEGQLLQTMKVEKVK